MYKWEKAEPAWSIFARRAAYAIVVVSVAAVLIATISHFVGSDDLHF